MSGLFSKRGDWESICFRANVSTIDRSASFACIPAYGKTFVFEQVQVPRAGVQTPVYGKANAFL